MEGITNIAPGMALVAEQLIVDLVNKIDATSRRVEELAAELKDSRKPYLTAIEVQELTGFGKSWLNDNKQDIGFTTIGGCLRFKRKDVEEYIEANYYKVKSKKRYS